VLEIIYQDEHLIAINKPHGLLVHRSPIANDATEFALQLLRDQVGYKVYPAHRLDRKTGGVLLFSKNKEMDSLIQQDFANQQIDKKYLAILRGYVPDQKLIDYPLKKENGTEQSAQTYYRILAQAELAIPLGQHTTSRYSLVEANPLTGRMHQIRKHFAHIFHPIIGDRPHGCNKQNRFWKETFEMHTMLLHASSIRFSHPATNVQVEIKAPLQKEFIRVLDILGISLQSHL